MFSYIRSWFLRPILDIENLNRRLNAVSFYCANLWGLFMSSQPVWIQERTKRKLIWSDSKEYYYDLLATLLEDDLAAGLYHLRTENKLFKLLKWRWFS